MLDAASTRRPAAAVARAARPWETPPAAAVAAFASQPAGAIAHASQTRPSPAMPFARTKIQWPRLRAAQQIERPALQAALTRALPDCRLLLVCAPAGYGKTAALAQLASERAQTLPDHALAWVALDEGDDLPQLLECLIAALEPHDPPWRVAPEALVAMAESGAPPLRIAAELVNTLAACDTPHGLIVLDDLHRLSDEPALAFLAHLVERLSPRWTVALGTRHEPGAPLPVARLRARGELAEFRQQALSFTPEEAQALVRCFGHDEAGAAQLHARTEGWPAGLRLALNAGPTAGAINRHVFDFLATEVVDQLGAELREFLLAVSVLGELDAPRCAAVTGNPRAALLLEEVERLGLFVTTVDSEAGTLRLHDLFREALVQRLARTRPDDTPRLLLRAAAAEPDAQRRLALLLRAGALEPAAELLHEQAGRWLTEGAVHSVQRLLAQFPSEVVAASAPLQIVAAQLAWARWEFGPMHLAAERAVQLATQTGQVALRQSAQAYLALALNARGRIDEGAAVLGPLRREDLADTTRVLALVASCWHALDLGSLHRVGPVLDETLTVLERVPRIEFWYMASPLSRFHGLPGTAGPLRRHAAGVRRLSGDAPTALSAVALLTEAWLAVWQGRLAEADVLVANADDDCRWLGDPINVRRMVRQQQALMHALRGRDDAAHEMARFALTRSVDEGNAWSAWQAVFLSARAAVVCGHTRLLRECLAALHPDAVMSDVSALAARSRPWLPLPGHLAWLEGRSDDAIAHWQAALAHEEQIDVLGQASELRLNLGLALLQAGRDDEALAALAPAVERARRERGPGGLLFARRALLALLAPALRTRLPAWLVEPLTEWAAMAGLAQDGASASGHSEPGEPADHGDLWDEEGETLGMAPALASVPAGAPAGALSVAGLSPRELEVLQRIAAGDSNKLIARAFDLSPHTVKRHVANVLGKLGVASRGQAAAWWRDHGG